MRLTASFWQVTRFAWMTDDERVMCCRRRSTTSSSSLIRIAVAKRDDDNDDQLRIRCRFAINRQNPPPIYRQISLELTILRERDARLRRRSVDEWTVHGRVESTTQHAAYINDDICQTSKLSRLRIAFSPTVYTQLNANADNHAAVKKKKNFYIKATKPQKIQQLSAHNFCCYFKPWSGLVDMQQ